MARAPRISPRRGAPPLRPARWATRYSPPSADALLPDVEVLVDRVFAGVVRGADPLRLVELGLGHHHANAAARERTEQRAAGIDRRGVHHVRRESFCLQA